MPNLVKPLDPSAAYVYCPICRNNGTPNSMLTRDMHILKCNFGHQFDVTDFASLAAAQPDMTPMSAILDERPDDRAIRWPIFVLPETKEAFECKFAGRVHITLGTYLSALTDDRIVIIDGEQAAMLKKRGLNNGAQIVSALDGMAKAEKERDEAVAQLDKLLNALNSSRG